MAKNLSFESAGALLRFFDYFFDFFLKQIFFRKLMTQNS